MTTMPINNNPLTKKLQFKGIIPNKLTFKSIKIIQNLSKNYNIFAALSAVTKTYFIWNARYQA